MIDCGRASGTELARYRRVTQLSGASRCGRRASVSGTDVRRDRALPVNGTGRTVSTYESESALTWVRGRQRGPRRLQGQGRCHWRELLFYSLFQLLLRLSNETCFAAEPCRNTLSGKVYIPLAEDRILSKEIARFGQVSEYCSVVFGVNKGKPDQFVESTAAPGVVTSYAGSTVARVAFPSDDAPRIRRSA